MKQLLFMIGYVLIGLSLLAGGMFTVIEAKFQEATVAVCFEDMPCWDCETMGNFICGPTE